VYYKLNYVLGFPPFHSHFTAKKKTAAKKGKLYFSAVRSHTRSLPLFVGLADPQYRFIALHLQAALHLHPAVSCLSPLYFSAVALFASAISVSPFSKLNFCSNLLDAKGCLIFFPPFHAHPTFHSVPTLNSRISCSIAAISPTALLIRYNSAIAPFLAPFQVLGVLIMH
jgi:hypothetical protein